MNEKGFFGFFSGMMLGFIFVIILIIAGVYIAAPHFIPDTPCLSDKDCSPQKVCCAWRCDSKDLSWWKCPEGLCNIIGKDEPDKECGCDKLRCDYA